MPEEQQATAAETQPTKSRKTLMIGLLVFVVMTVTVGSKFLLQKSAAASHKDARPKSVVHLESFIVNLSDHDDKAFLRVGIDLGVDKDVKEGKAAMENVPNVRDAIIGVLTAYKSEDLLSAEGKRQLKDNLLKSLTERAPELEVREIYFTDFLVQR